MNPTASAATSPYPADRRSRSIRLRGCIRQPGKSEQLFNAPRITDPDLVTIIDLWSGLPEAMKAGILATARAANG
jgi:hypothetical protein